MELNSLNGHWKDVFIQLGVPENFVSGKHGPCPFCGGEDRFRFSDKDSKGLSICNQCGSRNPFTFLKQFLAIDSAELFARIKELIPSKPVKVVKVYDNVAYHKKLCASSIPITEGDPVAKYLKSRCLPINENLKYLKPYMGVGHHVMLAKVQNDKGEVVALHKTLLTQDGQKANCEKTKLWTKPIGDLTAGAVRLFEPETILGIAEGIETALAANKLFNVPVWASLSATMLKKWVPPPMVRGVVIFGDNDANFTGQAAAFYLANKLVIEHKLPVTVLIPEIEGEDFADVLYQKNIVDFISTSSILR